MYWRIHMNIDFIGEMATWPLGEIIEQFFRLHPENILERLHPGIPPSVPPMYLVRIPYDIGTTCDVIVREWLLDTSDSGVDARLRELGQEVPSLMLGTIKKEVIYVTDMKKVSLQVALGKRSK